MRNQEKTAWAFLAPSLLLYGLYVVIPIFYTFYLSTTEWDGLGSVPVPLCFQYSEVSCFENYIELWEDDVFHTSFVNHLIWLVAFGLSPLIGLAMALFFHAKGWLSSLYKSLLFMPMVLSLVVVGMIWNWFLQPEFGLLEHLLKSAGLMAETSQVNILSHFTWATGGLIAAACWPHAAYCMVLFLAGLSNIRKNVIDAAAIDGANRWQLLWHIILPGLRPATIIVIVVTMIGALRTFEIVAIMTGGGPANSSNVLANYMYQQTFQSLRYGYGAAIAVCLFLISLGLILLYLHRTQKSED